MSEGNTNKIIDEELKEQLENTVHGDALLTEYSSQSGESNDMINEVSAWMPNSDEMQDETIIHPDQVKAMSVVRNYDMFYPEFKAENKAFNKILDDLEKYSVSVFGTGRKQQMEVLSSLISRQKEEEELNENSGKKLKVFND